VNPDSFPDVEDARHLVVEVAQTELI